MKLFGPAAPSAVIGAGIIACAGGVSPLDAQVVSVGEVRSIDGTGNQGADLGAAGTAFSRIAVPDYGDAINTPSGGDRPNARVVSNALSRQGGVSIPDPHGTTDWVWQWGQFLDHDITLAGSGSEPFNIAVNDPTDLLHNAGSPADSIPMMRTGFDSASGLSSSNPRQQMNQITSFIDGSMVYGSDAVRAAALRSGVGGALTIGGDGLMMRNTGGFDNANDAHILPDATLFLGGDVRANEQVGLTAVHTLFVWEHNRVAGEFLAANPLLDPVSDDEAIFQHARRIVSGQIQAITYNEFLPALMGSTAPSLLSASYGSGVDPRISNEFSILYRLGHTLVSGDTQKVDNNGVLVETIGLDGNFFNSPTILTDPGDVGEVLKGLASRVEQSLDSMIVEELQDFLFGPFPGAGGLDLAALNIQRGRDHGLPGYNDLRTAYGLLPVGTVADITSDLDVQLALEAIYVDGMGNFDPNLIDPWLGALAEDEVGGSMLGPLLTAAMLDQFERLRDGDRFFFLYDTENLTEAERDMIATRSLAEVIMDNTGITNLQPNVFLIPEPSTLVLLGAALFGIALRRRR
ncbi:MAG: peroxidase family protein [Verrucomicrobiota bacterium]